MSLPKLPYGGNNHHEPCYICGKQVHAEYCYCFGCSRVYCDQHSINQQEYWKLFPDGHSPNHHRKCRFYKIKKLESGWYIKIYRGKAGRETTEPDEAERYTYEDLLKWGRRDGWQIEP